MEAKEIGDPQELPRSRTLVCGPVKELMWHPRQPECHVAASKRLPLLQVTQNPLRLVCRSFQGPFPTQLHNINNVSGVCEVGARFAGRCAERSQRFL